MKKRIYSVLALAMVMLTMASCTNDDALTESVRVTFIAKLPGSTHSRSEVSFGTGEYVDKLHAAIYEKTGEDAYTFVHQDVTDRQGDGFAYSPYLTKGKTYKIAFWAMTKGAYQVSDDLQYIPIPPMTSNDPQKEAFAGVSGDVTVGESNGSPIDVELKRPFAMLNFATTMTSAQKEQKGSMKAEVTVTCTGGMATSYNAFDGKATYEETALTFSEAAIQGSECEMDGVKYIRLASCYVIPPADGSKTVTVGIKVKQGETLIGDLTETDIPLMVNHSTNLFGKMLTVTQATHVETN